MECFRVHFRHKSSAQTGQQELNERIYSETGEADHLLSRSRATTGRIIMEPEKSYEFTYGQPYLILPHVSLVF
jgi:hypothetical protein